MNGIRHPMPFGAAPEPGGGVRFRLWAPDAGQVELALTGAGLSERRLSMTRGPDGWFGLTVPDAGAGSRYRFVVDGQRVPDPASRAQPAGVHGPSEVVDAARFAWRAAPPSRPWHATVLYELHIGAFTAGGTFDSAIERLDHLAGTGITTIELMPVAAFAGQRNWGYDGVLPFAPHAAYGGPAALKALIDAAHARGLMVLLDVVYNHFGPEGNYLHRFARSFLTNRHRTPWGDAINFDGVKSSKVREFFIHNALYWLTEFRLDGLRLDAVHAIIDESSPHILQALASAVHEGPGREREVHLVLENDLNQARYLEPCAASAGYRAQWNDDFHHAAHTLATGETEGYYEDYADRPVGHLARCLAEGFAYQGDASRFRNGAARGEPSVGLPSTAFIDFLQNHDQIGNRARGERLTILAPTERLRALTAIVLLAPAVPALFMGEEFGSRQPFLYFADFEGELAEAVRSGRRQEFAHFAGFAQGGVPDPIAAATFSASRLDWDSLATGWHAAWHDRCRRLLAIRHEQIVPHLPATAGRAATFGGTTAAGPPALGVGWRLADGCRLRLIANLSDAPVVLPRAAALPKDGRTKLLWTEPEDQAIAADEGALGPWAVRVQLTESPV